MKCPQCGVAVPEGEKLCPSCSAAMASDDSNATWAGSTSATAAAAGAGDDVTMVGFTRPVVGSGVLTPPPGSDQTSTPNSPPTAPSSPNGEATWMGGPNSPTFGVTTNNAATAAPFTRGAMSPDSPTNAGRSASGAATAAALSGVVDFGPRYRVERLLGQGGMGAVYLAQDQVLDRQVALKLVKPELAVHPEAMARFRQELLLASKISHRNILRIHDLGETAGTQYISMAFVDGEDLHHLLTREGKLPLERVLHITRQLCAALDAAHSEGIVHRDLKPQNILLGSNDHVYVSDFGLAKSLGAISSMTQSGEMLGTPRYMAPEQVEAKSVDARTDIYSLGLIFYEMVTGDVPFTAESTLQLMYKRAHEAPPAPNTVVPDLPEWLNNVIMKCLERDPANRYQSTREILADIETQRAPDLAPQTRTLVVPVTTKRKPYWWWIGIAAAILVVAGALLAVPQIRNRIFGSTIAGRAQTGKAVTVLVADFNNHTGDTTFDGTLEPMFNVALEGASFINAFNRGTARKLAQKLPNSTDKLDEQPARLVALSQGVSAVITGEVSRRGDSYEISAIALDSATGNVLAKADLRAANKEEVLPLIPKLVAPIRKALGDTTPESAQLERAGGAFSAGSLEAVHQYAMGMDEQFAGKFEEALKSFSKATEIDPNFARAYSGMAAMAGNLGRLQDAEGYIKLAIEHVDRMTDRERYRVRGQYYIRIGNWPKCVDEYSELIKRYPGDNIGHANLALCYSQVRNLSMAVEEARVAVNANPKGAGLLGNLSLFSSYGGDFQSGEREALKLQQLSPSDEYGYLAMAFAQLGQGKMKEAAESYDALEKVSQVGSSMAAGGLADLAMYQGRFADAIAMLERGIEADTKAKRQDSAADKYAALAQLQLWRDQKRLAVTAADKALANSQSGKTKFLAARVYAEADESPKAQKLASALTSDLKPEQQAYGKIIEGQLAVRSGKSAEAVKFLTEANSLLDSWIGHFELGRAYLKAGAFTEADSEFDRAIKRKGESIALFLDEVPTFSFFPYVYYYQGQVREGMKSAGFADSYRTYLSMREQASDDPLVPELRKRVGQ